MVPLKPLMNFKFKVFFGLNVFISHNEFFPPKTFHVDINPNIVVVAIIVHLKQELEPPKFAMKKRKYELGQNFQGFWVA
jgi:hypothetical protein